MEDLKEYQCDMNDFVHGLSLIKVEQVVESIASLQAYSILDTSWMDKFPEFPEKKTVGM